MAEAARRDGAATAAFLEEPFVSATGIIGFDSVLEEPALWSERLVQLTAEHFERHVGERVALWLHLRNAGPAGRDLGDLLAGLHRALDATGRRNDSLVVVTGFSSELSGDERLRVPCIFELPSSLNAGRRGVGSASLVDVALILLKLMHVDAPDVTAGEKALQSRVALAALIGGTNVHEWVLLEDEDGVVLRTRAERVASHGRPPVEDELLLTQVAGPEGGYADAPDERRAALLARFRAATREAARDATPAERCAPEWPGW